ncbi:histidinol dehydrogenase [Pseudomonas nitroreducens]|uniref:histidinol dehydrogenase n=1 Tax=Pseudomonas nitroreducens TaxID=46680 RepID=UPI0009FFA178|nr:histidinol dehydrogenase [Pseudomonas nitroreducens]NMZ60777.1 histidinol dehydrogenase [Pseudomonas nitroreducens]SNT44202.1 histidinol dehydrogenase/sulfopropanediol 3-dehydrogenase [Pseudomonas nitroreducens]
MPIYIKAPEPKREQESRELREMIAALMNDVQERGDAALRDYSEKFDGMRLEQFEVTAEEIEAARQACDEQLLADMRFGIERIRAFAEAQLKTLQPLEVETLPGLHLGHRLIPIQRVGAYVPGGRYPLLSTAQMSIIPAKVAGVEEIIVCTPPKVHPAVLYAAHLSGATRIFRVGGAQAIAAFTHGTESIPQVDKICGPGNMYVNEAKRQAIGSVGIDQLAGPSEIFTLADDSADPKILAADMLGQAEHDVETRVGLITTSRDVAEKTLAEVERQLTLLATREVAEQSWRKRGEIVLCDSLEEAIAYSDEVAAEHLQVHTRDPHGVGKRLRNYGSLFIGVEASVVYSDKISGTNHTLPTGGAGKYTGGVWVGTFIKVCTHQWLDQRGVEAVAPVAVRQSTREGLEGHRKAAEIRYHYDVV